MLRPLPVGIQTFGDIIRGGFLYVDKTRWIHELVRYVLGLREIPVHYGVEDYEDDLATLKDLAGRGFFSSHGLGYAPSPA